MTVKVLRPMMCRRLRSLSRAQKVVLLGVPNSLVPISAHGRKLCQFISVESTKWGM
ncbi:hypothetical protein RchiOBHm_Chr3g0466671 [Rosa chinensis]|uniref:Uncharacterized protein n=1 Tax=Rosa chinensis TaxID=74649 RepID=A0A2P6RA13_ROSCH|nr:hypothetical protein RchiOBHm_Chr3g0466671 [Rosa chinensis]